LFHHHLNEWPEEGDKYPFPNYGKPLFINSFNLFLRLKGLKKVEEYHTGWVKSRTFKTVAYKRLYLFFE